ncbi:MAG: adenine nucleotide alpha hydrolase [Alphaproteobacteria bacterium]|nr:adenine nucleotide alpha hydrolase [Alphaproteobacteria bacterium]
MSQTEAKPKAILAWSSGKDSAYALHVVRREGLFDVIGLLTTVTHAYGRVSMHGVREDILDLQALRAGLGVTKVRIPAPCPNEIYETAMAQALQPHVDQGVSHVIFGDLFLADLRQWREERLAEIGLEGVFPLWRTDTGNLAREMLAAGLKARVVCLDPARLDRSFAGRAYDAGFLEDLPEDVDPCGENGEFHTLVTAGPMFSAAIDAETGEVVERDGFVFADVQLTR